MGRIFALALLTIKRNMHGHRIKTSADRADFQLAIESCLPAASNHWQQPSNTMAPPAHGWGGNLQWATSAYLCPPLGFLLAHQSKSSLGKFEHGFDPSDNRTSGHSGGSLLAGNTELPA
jgi:hypothetical protein